MNEKKKKDTHTHTLEQKSWNIPRDVRGGFRKGQNVFAIIFF